MLRDLYYMLPLSMRSLVRRVYYLPYDFYRDIRFGRDRMEPPKGKTFVGGGDFKKQGEIFLKFFLRFSDLKPDHRILDVGSGIGRMAVPFVDFLSEKGSYEGFDLVNEGIEWCQNRIAKEDPRFHFQHVDIENKLYNPKGKILAHEFVFPFEDNSFDFIFLTSVFTHMMPEEVEQYLQEIARVLKPGGQSFITYFLLDDTAKANIEAGKSHKDFKFEKGKYRLMHEKVDTANVAYESDYIFDLYQQNNMKLESGYQPGWWSGKPKGNDYQDIIVGRKR